MNTSIKSILNQYKTVDVKSAKKEVEHLLSERVEKINKPTVWNELFSLIDLTSLNTTDTEEDIARLTEKVNEFGDQYAAYNQVAAICVYPVLVKTVRELLTENVEIAAVCGGFPHAQTFIEVKIAETSLAILDGATEIDVVMSIGKLLEKKYDEIIEEIGEIKSACRDASLKVIIESGALSLSDVRIASILAMEAGADFIKTSTGKQQPGATLEAAWCICQTIAEHNRLRNRKVGFKAAGGIATKEEALNYYCIVDALLGKEWLNKDRFRIGASRLANALFTEMTGEKKAYF